jgi:hypothetical protein
VNTHESALLDGSNCTEHTIQFTTLVELEKAAHGAVVAAAHKLAVNPNGRHGRTTEETPHFRTQGLAIRISVQFHHSVLGLLGVKSRFSLDAERSRGKAQHEDFVIRIRN